METKPQDAFKLKPLHFGVLMFFLLIVFNIPYLYNPPYSDDIIGLHNQAVFIAKHGFNPVALWNDEPVDIAEPHYPLATNSNVYPYSITPWIHAVFYRFLKPMDAHLAGHIFNIACLSIAAALAFAILLKHTKEMCLAIAVTLLAFLEPILAGRTAALCQECPLVAATMGVLFLLSQNRLPQAFALAILAVLCKPSGVAIQVVVVAVMLTRLGLKWRNIPRPALIAIVLALLATVGGGLWLLKRHLLLGQFTWSDLEFSITYKVPVAMPYVILLTVVSTAFTVWWMHGEKKWDWDDPLSNFRLGALLFLWGMLATMVCITTALPRYAAVCTLPACTLLGLSLRKFKLAHLVLIIGVLAIVLLWHPMMSLPPQNQRGGEFLERSRDYLKDLSVNQKFCSIMAKEIPPEVPVFVKWPFGQMLTMPEFGYVDEPRPNVYVAENIIPKYAPVKQAKEYEQLAPNGVFLFTPSTISFNKPVLLPAEEPKIIYRDNSLPGDAFLFRMQ